MSNKATVFPRQNAPIKQRDDDDESRGVWKSQKELPDDWRPQKVDIYPFKINFDEGTPNGVWGVNPSVKPNKDGQYDPKDLWFYPPGEMPENDEECVPCGKWSYREFSDKKWPPPKKNKRVVGKLPPIWKEHIPPKAIIYPRRQAPKVHGKNDVARGIWRFPKGEEKTESAEDSKENWVPCDVQMYEDGDEPEDWDVERPCGVWGISANVDSNDHKPTDMWFYPPNVEPEEGFIPVGKWRLPPKKPWPPRSIGTIEHPTYEFTKVEKKQTKVGKLKLPDFLSGK
eukprot:scaffold26060_cov211-Cylindrotheca_fusiformis.AAC.2